MRFRTWPVAATALGATAPRRGVGPRSLNRRAQEIYTELDQLNQRYHGVESTLRRLRSDVHMSGIYVRDYLLDPDRERAPEYRERIAAFRRANDRRVQRPGRSRPARRSASTRWTASRPSSTSTGVLLDPLFDWTPAEKATQSVRFLRREVIPRREAALAIARQIEELNATTLATQRTEVAGRQAELRRDLFALLAWGLVLGSVVALTAVYRLQRLERSPSANSVSPRKPSIACAQLSQQLVATQEEERKKLSRELHDHVGQVLTALRMELGSMDRLRSPGDQPLASAVAESRQLVDNMVRTVRDLALGLRPSMLDDFGLQPAVEWHVRDFTRRFGLPVDLRFTANSATCPNGTPRASTASCRRRSPTACATRAASKLRVSVSGLAGRSRSRSPTMASVSRPRAGGSGLGLRGIEERVRRSRRAPRRSPAPPAPGRR